MSKIRNKAKAILVEWLKTLLSEEEQKKVNVKNVLTLLPNQTHYWQDTTLKLQPWSYKWVVKKLKNVVVVKLEVQEVQEVPQVETTPFWPRSPYACAKVYAHWLTVNYRESYNMHASSGILFNHESPRRGETFVTRKITRAATRIKLGQQNKLILGNLDSKRDWGYAKEYVEAMWLMLQQDKPGDFVIATNETHTVREFLEETFACLDLDWNEYVGFDKKYERPAEVDLLIGNPQKAKKQLGWEPKTTFKDLVSLMVEEDMKLAQREKTLAEANLA